MTTTKLIFIILFLSLAQLHAQSTKFYFTNSDTTKVDHIDVQNVKHTIELESVVKERDKETEALSLAPSFILSTVVPILFKQVGKWFYNPKNYIKEYGAVHSFYDSKSGFKKLPTTGKITIKTTGKLPDNVEREISRFTFELDSILNKNGYYQIALSEGYLNYTPVKLKSNHKKVNVVLEMKFIFYDSQDFKREYSLNPIKLSEVCAISGKKNGNEIKIEKKLYQIIPRMNVLESVQLKVTEINSRKKDWDKWLEFYNKNEGKISSFVLEKIIQ